MQAWTLWRRLGRLIQMQTWVTVGRDGGGRGQRLARGADAAALVAARCGVCLKETGTLEPRRPPTWQVDPVDFPSAAAVGLVAVAGVVGQCTVVVQEPSLAGSSRAASVDCAVQAAGAAQKDVVGQCTVVVQEPSLAGSTRAASARCAVQAAGAAQTEHAWHDAEGGKTGEARHVAEAACMPVQARAGVQGPFPARQLP